jgi:hypothetical protein
MKAKADLRVFEATREKGKMLNGLAEEVAANVGEMLTELWAIADTHPRNGRSRPSLLQMGLAHLLNFEPATDGATAAIARDFGPVYEHHCNSSDLELVDIDVTMKLHRPSRNFARALRFEFMFPRWYERVTGRLGKCPPLFFLYEVVCEGPGEGEVSVDWPLLGLFDLNDMQVAHECFYACRR